MNSAPDQPNLPVLIYIMGTARSGSTILEILLASGKDAIGAGELSELIRDGFIEDRRCSCGELTSKCELWRGVKERVGLADYELENLNRQHRRIDWHLGLARQMLGGINRHEMAVYNDTNQRIIGAIGEMTGCDFVIDSSKYAGRALALGQACPLRVYVICLTRSPAGLMAAFQKPNRGEQLPKSPLKTLFYYLVVSSLLRLAGRQLRNQIMYLRYEELLKDPIGALTRIEKFCGMELTVAKKNIARQLPFDVGHIVTGNRIRKMGQVSFAAESSDPSLTSTSQRAIASLMGAWKSILRF
ncbi:MAG: hypothetical protein HOK21_17585 [Rhodospirillaceae bacterium]|jgi:hypothetical protein|nr:hypothetical protein [Rhodospirillaceae bacterium]MBT4688453.1 hypothetical protein [Rhodospirillaceae bacterium]MBT5079874.1 hypothetical protein [Rhodospirillaceae bacterium]MBT5525896.1 hypothetical protein [Rhodospirillaceae bacterium]MBT5879458.1 hypothetical protein [Rhodospirillaceae bacterium]